MQNPLIPMIAITGRPDRARMAQLLDAYKSVGISQFLIYPRSGLEIEYMSEAWLPPKSRLEHPKPSRAA